MNAYFDRRYKISLIFYDGNTDSLKLFEVPFDIKGKNFVSKIGISEELGKLLWKDKPPWKDIQIPHIQAEIKKIASFKEIPIIEKIVKIELCYPHESEDRKFREQESYLFPVCKYSEYQTIWSTTNSELIEEFQNAMNNSEQIIGYPFEFRLVITTEDLIYILLADFDDDRELFFGESESSKEIYNCSKKNLPNRATVE